MFRAPGLVSLNSSSDTASALASGLARQQATPHHLCLDTHRTTQTREPCGEYSANIATLIRETLITYKTSKFLPTQDTAFQNGILIHEPEL
jgi:hypothetical protein